MASRQNLGTLKDLPSGLRDQLARSLDAFKNDQSSGVYDRLDRLRLTCNGQTHDGLTSASLPVYTLLLKQYEDDKKSLQLQQNELSRLQVRLRDITDNVIAEELPTPTLEKLKKQAGTNLDDDVIEKMSTVLRKRPALAVAFQRHGLLASTATQAAIEAVDKRVKQCESKAKSMKLDAVEVSRELDQVKRHVADLFKTDTSTKIELAAAPRPQAELDEKDRIIAEKDRIIAEKVAEIADGDEALDLRTSFVKHRDETIRSLRSKLADLDRTIHAKTAVISEKDGEITSKTELVDSKENELKVKDASIADKDKTLEQKDSLLALKEQDLQAKIKALDESNGKLQAKTDALTQRDRDVRDKLGIIAARDRDLQSKIQALGQVDQQLKAKTDALTQSGRDVQEKLGIIAAKDQDLEAKAKAVADKNREIGSKDAVIAQMTKDLDAKAQEVKSRDSVIVGKTQELESKDAVIVEKDKLIIGLRGELEEHQSALNQALDELWNVQLDALRTEIKTTLQQHELNGQVADEQARAKAHASQLEDLGRQLLTLEAVNGRWRGEAASLSRTVEESNSKASTLQSQLQAAKSTSDRHGAVIREHEEKSSKLESRTTESTRHAQEASEMSHALETGVTKHAASAQRVKSDLDRLGDEMSQCHLAETKLRQRADQLESSCEGLRARLRDGRTQAEEHAARIKGLESAKADLDDKLLQATSTCTDLDVEKFILETQVRFLDKKLAETVVERNAVSGQLATAGDRLGHANRQVEALTTKLNGACSLAEYRGVYEDFLLYGLAPDQNPDVSSLQAAHLAIKQFTTSLRSVRTGVRCVARFEVSSLQTAVLEQAHDICFGMLLSACSGRHLHLDTLQRLVVSLRSSDEAEVRQCLPLIFGTVQRLMRKELDFDGRVLILRCLDLLVAYGQSPLLGEVVAHLHAMKAHSGLLCSAYIDWLSEAVDGAPDCLAARIGAEARRQNVMLELNGFGIMVDCDWVLMVHSEHGIAVLRPDQLNVEFDPFGPGTICFRDAPFIGTLAMGYAANQASFVVGCLLPALVNMTSLQS